MKNLKRALSLALSSIMLMGMMVVGTGAKGYDDVTVDHNVEAIEVLEAMGVMEGTDVGFEPDAKVTREQMAVIMCNVLDLTVSSYKGTTSFTDVAEWALPYVEACYTNGIISGYSATEFGAKDNLTTGQAALMLMKALGYFQEAGDFGQDWLVATTKQGALIDLFAGVKNGAKEALTRNDVAQLVLNALKADMVQIESYDVVADGKGGFTTKANYDSRDKKGTWDYTANYVNDQDDTLQLIEELYGNTFKTWDTADCYGRPSTEWTNKLETVGVYADKKLASYTTGVSRHDLYTLLGSTVVGMLKDGDATLELFQNGEKMKSAAPNNPAVPALYTASVDTDYIVGADVQALFAMKNAKSGSFAGTGRGVQTEVYMDNAGNVTIVEIYTYVAQAVTDYNTVKETVMYDSLETGAVAVPAGSTTGTLSSDDWDGLEEIQSGDYLLINVAYNNTNNNFDVTEVAIADVMSGTVEAYDQDWELLDAGQSVTVDGTPYNYSSRSGSEGTEDYAIGETASFVMDQFGYIIAIADANTTGTLAYVMDAQPKSGLLGTTYEALLVFTDGTGEAVTLKKVDGDKANIGNYNRYADAWCYFNKNADGTYSLSSLAAKYTNKGGNYTLTADAALVDGDVVAAYNTTGLVTSEYVNNKDSVLIVIDHNFDTYVYQGVGNMPEINYKDTDSANDNIQFRFVYKNNSPSYVAYAVLDLSTVIDDGDSEPEYTIIDGAAAPEFVFVLDKVAETNAGDGVKYYTYKTLQADGSIVKTVFEDAAELEYKLVYKTHVNSAGRVTNMQVVPNTGRYFNFGVANGDALTYSGHTLRIAGNNYIVNNDTKIMLVSREPELNKDTGAKYEVNQITMNYLVNALKQDGVAGKAFTGFMAGSLVEATSAIIDVLYVYVTDIP